MADNSPPDNRLSMTSTNADDASPNAAAELSVKIDDLLNQLSNKFAGVSSEIFAKMDEMSRRLDNLEQNLQASNDRSGSRDGKSSPTKM